MRAVAEVVTALDGQAVGTAVTGPGNRTAKLEELLLLSMGVVEVVRAVQSKRVAVGERLHGMVTGCC